MKMRRATFSSLSLTICLCAILCVLGGFYLFFLNQSVVHVVMRTSVQGTIADIQTEIASLEGELIESQFEITERLATLDQFQVDAEKIFITRADSSLVMRSE